MANKKISDLQLRTDFDATCNVPVDDATQSYRVTGAQIAAFAGGEASVITSRTEDTSPAADDSLLIYDLSATAMKKVKKSNLLKKAVVAKAATFTASLDEDVYLCTMGSSYTATLPTAVGNGGKVFEFKLQTSTTNILTIDGNGSETIDGALTIPLYGQHASVRIVSDGANWHRLKQQEPRSEVFVNGGNGSGSTNTAIRRYTTPTTLGGAITYADSATLGASFTINEDGVYSLQCSDESSSDNGAAFGFSVDSNQLSTNITTITAANIIGYKTVENTNRPTVFTRVMNLRAGMVIRPHHQGSAMTGTGTFRVWAQITKVSN
jgi:hypothetical protein